MAGRSVASSYNYYDTKADPLIALAEEFHAEATQLAVLPYRAGLAGEEALREAVAGFWRTYAKRRGEAITRIATAIRAAQSDGYCPGVDPVLTASAPAAMLEHFCYIWLGQGGEKDSGRTGHHLGQGRLLARRQRNLLNGQWRVHLAGHVLGSS